MTLNSWHIATAAEAIAAAQFARCGWDVSVQYGANQPEYDLMVAQGNLTLKISVKGSQDGGWGLTQSYLQNAQYHLAVDDWMKKHSRNTVFFLVQFEGISLDQLPRCYLVWPAEIANWLKRAAKGRGDTVLYERHVWTARAFASGTVDEIPTEWRFSPERLLQMANAAEFDRGH